MCLSLGVALVALLPRLGPARAGWRRSNDGAEYVLLARSLARGEGYVLPVRVRYLEAATREAPPAHAAWGERAPLWPLVLAGWLRLIDQADPGWPDPLVQLPGVLLCALAAAQAAGLAAFLARREGLGPRGQAASGLSAGLTVALAPALLRASLHTWAEPLGVVLALLVARLLLGLEARAPVGWFVGSPSVAGQSVAGRSVLVLALGLGLLAGLARFARPEQVALGLALALLCLRRGLRLALPALLLGWVVVNGLGVALTGTLAPQLSLLRVADHAQLMQPNPELAPPTAAQVLGGIARNGVHLLSHLATPRYAWLTLPAALLALGRTAPRGLLGLALALLLAPALVWSTDDPHRFALAPLCLLAPVAAVEWERRRRAWLGPRTWPRAAWLAGLVLVLGWQARGWQVRPVDPPPALPAPREEDPLEGPALEDPWSYALLTGRPARLAAGGAAPDTPGER